MNKEKKIAFINSTITGDFVPPFGLLSIASYILSKNIVNLNNIRILDININNIIKDISIFKPDVICISSMTISYNSSIKLAKKIKKSLPNTYIMIGGVHISIAPWSFSDVFSLGILGEGEITFLK